MGKSKVATFVIGGIAATIIVFLIGLILIKALWSWTVPELFPGAVEQGLVAGTISWSTAAKLALLAAVLLGLGRNK